MNPTEKSTKAQLIIITGTNGVGKSTFGRLLTLPFIDPHAYFKKCYVDYNTLCEEAQLERITNELFDLRMQYFKDKVSFAMEKRLASHRVIEFLIRHAHENGFEVTLIYIGLNDLNIAYDRITLRDGVNAIKSLVIKEHFYKGIACFKKIAPKIDRLILYDNTQNQETKNLKKLYERHKGHVRFKLKNQPNWTKLLEIF